VQPIRMLALQENHVPRWHSLGARQIAEENDRATERPDGPDATTPCELREPTHLPEPQPRTAFKSVLSHGRTHSRKEPADALWPRAELMVCG
jgi:hypothetical protein